MAKLHIPVGIPGCGKSTFAWTVLEHSNLRVVSSDAIRLELSHDYDQTRNDEVFAIFHQRIEDYLLNDLDVFADATNLNAFARENLYKIADRACAEVHAWVFANVNQAVIRNGARSPEGGRVPVPAMEYMFEKWEQTLSVIDTEPHASITYIRDAR